MEPRPVGAGDNTEESSSEEDKSEGDCGNVPLAEEGTVCVGNARKMGITVRVKELESMGMLR